MENNKKSQINDFIKRFLLSISYIELVKEKIGHSDKTGEETFVFYFKTKVKFDSDKEKENLKQNCRNIVYAMENRFGYSCRFAVVFDSTKFEKDEKNIKIDKDEKIIRIRFFVNQNIEAGEFEANDDIDVEISNDIGIDIEPISPKPTEIKKPVGRPVVKRSSKEKPKTGAEIEEWIKSIQKVRDDANKYDFDKYDLDKYDFDKKSKDTIDDFFDEISKNLENTPRKRGRPRKNPPDLNFDSDNGEIDDGIY